MKRFNALVFFIAAAMMLYGGAGLAAGTPILVPNSYVVTFKPSPNSPIVPPGPKNLASSVTTVPFGEHSTGQSKVALAAALGIKGEVASIFEAINAALLRIDAVDAERLRNDPRVLRVEQDRVTRIATVQVNPGWALDRIDQPPGALNQQYVYNSSGAGRTIWILDSGLNLNYPGVVAEFGGRASVFADVNGGAGLDCFGHGTRVASAAAGSTYGVAKGATVKVVKITYDNPTGCTGGSTAGTITGALNWIAVNAPRGNIVNISSALVVLDSNGQVVCGTNTYDALDDAVRVAYNAGIITVVAAGNDGCDTANYSPTRVPQAFVVGATHNYLIPAGLDVRASFSRYGSNISNFAPGAEVAVMNLDGTPVTDSGTSFSAPYTAGIFAAACQVGAPFCETASNAGAVYDALRNAGTMNTVVEPNGSAPPGGTPSRFISRSPW